MVPGNNDLEPTKIIHVSSFKIQGNHHLYCLYVPTITGRARLIRSHSSARFYFEISGIRINSII